MHKIVSTNMNGLPPAKLSLVMAAGLLCAGQGLTAQTTVPTAGATPEEEAIELSPFTVESTEDEGYRATNTLAGTRIRTELRDVGSAISVVTSKFLADTGARNTQDLLVYTTNTEVGGASGNFANTGGRSDTTEQRLRPQNNTRVRGLTSADNTRDFFLTDIPWDSYNVGRVDLQRGPNSILFGLGSPAGIVNASTNGAAFRDANTAEVRFGSFGSYRGSLDINKVILPDELAIRASALNDKTFYRQDPAYNHDTRAYAAFRFDPKILNGGSAKTSLKANFEKGDIDANRPRITAPRDGITPWFNSPTLNKRLYSAQTIADTSPEAFAADPTAGGASRFITGSTPNPRWSPYINNGAGGQIFDEATAWFNEPGSSTQGGLFEPAQSESGQANLPAGVAFPWTVYMGISGHRTYANTMLLPGNSIGAVRDYTVNDRRIFDSFNHLIDGHNKNELTKFETYNIALSQTFFDNRLGFEAVYDAQQYQDEVNQLLGGDPLLSVDIMRTLPDGRTNANAGRAFVAAAPNSSSGRMTDREALRITGFAELNFRDFMEESKLRSFLGRHVFTGLYMDQRVDTENRSWYSYGHSADYRAGLSNTIDSRRVNSIHYLSGNLVSASLPDLGIQNLDALQMPTSGTIKDFNPALKPGATAPFTRDSVQGWQDRNIRILNGFSGADRNSLYNNATKFRDDVNSKAIVWQAYLFEGILVPTVGYRKDRAESYNAGDKYTNPDQSVIVDDPRWTIPTGADDPRFSLPLGDQRNLRYSSIEGDSTSWSVVLHTPNRIKERMPWRTNVSLSYNQSDNFQSAGGRTDVFGNIIGAPTGKTKDYGFTVSTLDDRVTLRVNWYETTVTNANLDGGGTGNLTDVYRIGLGENWGRAFANWAKLGIESFTTNYALVDPANPASGLIDPAVPVLRYQAGPGETVAQALTRQNNAINALLANPPPANFAQHWQIQLEQDWAGGWGTHKGANQPSSLAVTGDTFSEGIEFELSANPTRNWNVAINASKTKAQRNNLAQSFATWVEDRNELFKGPAGDVQLWGGNFGQQTIGGTFRQGFYGSYQLYRQLEGSDVPELRPWRFNAVTNYTFNNGPLKGVNVGGGYRWQDNSVIGFAVANPGTANESYDISRPFLGPKETAIDLWAGYERKLTAKLGWRIQLNIRNAAGDDDFIPLSVQPDGSTAVARIPEPTVWSITNTFKF